MKKMIKNFVIILTVAGCLFYPACKGDNQVYAQTGGNFPILPADYQKMLGKGMDVDWSKTGARKRNYSESAVRKFKKAGIRHVRIRVKDAVTESLFVTLDEQINDCLKYGLIPVLAYQANEFKNVVSDQSMLEAVEWWRMVAEHYKNYPYQLSFDLLIECSDALNKQPERLNEYFEKAVGAIRLTNPGRIVIISPRVRSDAAYLNDLEIPSRANGYIMAEWHFYASGPGKTNPGKLWTTGTKLEKALIKDKINLALAWQQKTGIPTWVGAWMAGNYNDGNDYTLAEQIEFAHYMITQLEGAGIPYAVNSDTKFYNRETDRWIRSMLPLRHCIVTSYQKAVRMLFENSQNQVSSIKKVSKSSIRIKWTDIKRADGYIITISTSPGFWKDRRQAAVTGTEKVLKGLRTGTTYYVKVKGHMRFNGKKVYSEYSKQKSIRL